ncbi:MAG: hypothetical protein VX519_12545 [Myxococcota bacterium]|nr:hypothetical protein [Myxococcota bacterium]
MTRFTSFLLLNACLLAFGCVTQKDGATEDTQQEVADTSEDSGTDTQNVWDDTACDEPEGDAGQSYEADDPRVTMSAGTYDLSAVDGQYVSLDCATNISASQPMGGATSREVYLTLEGSLDYAGPYNVISLQFVEIVGSDGPAFDYEAADTSGVTFDVTGFGPNQAAYGELSGPLTITDAAGEELEITSLVVQAWPEF